MNMNRREGAGGAVTRLLKYTYGSICARPDQELRTTPFYFNDQKNEVLLF
jgi:hypothetical protein